VGYLADPLRQRGDLAHEVSDVGIVNRIGQG
jgi:hypothetical protein